MTDIKSLTLSELTREMESIGEKKFRAAQIYSWLHERLVDDFDEMTNLSKGLREKLKENYEDFYKNLNNIEENNISENTICVIIGIDRFLSDLDDGETEFYEMLNKATEYGNYNFIISENATKFKNHEYDEWYKKYVINDDGIWIGKGINDQYVINVNTSDGGIVNNCNSSFGYIVKDETPTFIKLLEMNERDEDNE